MDNLSAAEILDKGERLHRERLEYEQRRKLQEEAMDLRMYERRESLKSNPDWQAYQMKRLNEH